MSGAGESPLPGPLIWTVAGSAVAVLGFTLPQLWWGPPAIQVAFDVPFITVGLVSLFAQRSLTGSSQAARLRAALWIAALLAAAVGVAAYWLYAFERPELLAARLVRAGGAVLRSDVAASGLDARLEAAALAAALLLVGFVIGSFVAFRARVALRHRSR